MMEEGWSGGPKGGENSRVRIGLGNQSRTSCVGGFIYSTLDSLRTSFYLDTTRFCCKRRKKNKTQRELKTSWHTVVDASLLKNILDTWNQCNFLLVFIFTFINKTQVVDCVFNRPDPKTWIYWSNFRGRAKLVQIFSSSCKRSIFGGVYIRSPFTTLSQMVHIVELVPPSRNDFQMVSPLVEISTSLFL